MEIIEIQKKALVLDEDEIKKLRIAFEYLQHRIVKHRDKQGVGWMCQSGTDLDFVEYILIKLEEMNRT